MANMNHDNASYLNFLENLNTILMDYNINRISYT